MTVSFRLSIARLGQPDDGLIMVLETRLQISIRCAYQLCSWIGVAKLQALQQIRPSILFNLVVGLHLLITKPQNTTRSVTSKYDFHFNLRAANND